MNNKAKLSGMKLMLLITLIGMFFGFLWNSQNFPIKQITHTLLNPTAGYLLNQNVSLGMLIITALISFLTMLIQKYTLDHARMRELKKEQKVLQEEMKKYSNHPEKIAELTKKQFTEIMPQLMDVTMRSTMYTFIPLIFLFRWFSDYFIANPVKIFGILHWLLAYIIFASIFASIFKKILKIDEIPTT